MADVKTVSILGATGSIGTSTLDLINHDPELYDVRVLTAGSNVDRLIPLVEKFNPQIVGMADETKIPQLKQAIAPGVEVVSVIEAAQVPVDWTMAAIVGTAGLMPTMEAIKHGKTVAFASKECLVAAGRLMMDAVRHYGTTLLPVDSEHNAVFQVFDPAQRDRIERLILTASGGPFRGKSYEFLEKVTPEQAVAHPTWNMGAKISVDSATLMNKALEIIEAHHLFQMPSDKIDVMVHPQSLVHSLVEYSDGSLLAQMGPNDMRTPIAYCLGWPDRIQTSGPKFNWMAAQHLTFEQPDIETFRSLRLVRDVMASGQDASIIFNAANEIAVAAFLNHEIGFTQIYDVIESALAHGHEKAIGTLDDVQALDQETRLTVLETIENKDTKKYYA